MKTIRIPLYSWRDLGYIIIYIIGAFIMTYWLLNVEFSESSARYGYREMVRMPLVYMLSITGGIAALYLAFVILTGKVWSSSLELNSTQLDHKADNFAVPWSRIRHVAVPKSEKGYDNRIIIIYWSPEAAASHAERHIIDLRFTPRRDKFYDRVVQAIEARTGRQVSEETWPDGYPKKRKITVRSGAL